MQCIPLRIAESMGLKPTVASEGYDAVTLAPERVSRPERAPDPRSFSNC
ncbi:MAG: hypothetical protein NZ960_02480 [Candidatus Kapabacteria bacterium]|nr:hypothetical protein [Candidatus Kapabacteria bacterium]